LRADIGLSTVLMGRDEVEDAIQPWKDSTLAILAAGPIPPQPSELLESKAMVSLLERLSKEYDAVFLDSPPILAFADALIISRYTDATLMVVGVPRIKRSELQEALDSLSAVNTTIVGVVLNSVTKGARVARAHSAAQASEDQWQFGQPITNPSTSTKADAASPRWPLPPWSAAPGRLSKSAAKTEVA
jgi:polysaccharide biosynthesis transport protein